MTKQEAAAYLTQLLGYSFSVRTLERRTTAGEIPAGHKAGGRGKPALDYNPEDLMAFAEKEKTAQLAPAQGLVLPPAASPPAAMLAGALAGDVAARFVAALEAMAEQPGDHVFLSLPEAAKESGLAVGLLRLAVRAGELPTRKGIGGGYGKVARGDLRAYAKRLPSGDLHDYLKGLRERAALLAAQRKKGKRDG